MLQRLVFASASVLALSAAAQATDLYAPGSFGYKDAPGASYWVPTWSGFYAGANVGGAWSNNSVALSGLGAAAGWARYYPNPFRARKVDGSGVIGGSEIGYSRQIGSIVVGVEADYSGRSDVASLTSACGAWPCTVYENQRLDWVVSARGRIGFAPASQTLFYATGGFAVGGASGLSRLDTASTQYDIAGYESKTGWTAGGGVEYAISRQWSLKVEYLFVNLGNMTLIANSAPENLFQTKTVFDDREYIVRAGVNYHVGANYAPLY